METKFNPDYAIHPGIYLNEVLESRGIKKSDLAERSGISPKTISQLIAKKTLYSPDVALVLERTLGISASIWMSMLEKYQLTQARLKNRKELGSTENLNLLKKFPLSDLRKIHVLPDTKNKIQLLEALLRFLGVADLSTWKSYNSNQLVLFRKSNSFQDNDYSTAIWLKIAKDKSEMIQTAKYSKQDFEAKMADIRGLTKFRMKEALPKLKEICSKVGIALVLVPEFHGTHLSGASFWLTPSKATIALSLRFKTSDHFWFTFFHEVGHILFHSKKAIYLDSAKGNDSSMAIEEEADQFAKDSLMPSYEWKEFVKAQSFSGIRIQEFANRLKIHPGIIVGRLQREDLLPYSHLNHLKEKIGKELFE